MSINHLISKTTEDVDLAHFIHRLIEEEYIRSDGAPIKCLCGCNKICAVPKDHIEYGGWHVCELEAVCADCRHCLGYWAYGMWELPVHYYRDLLHNFTKKIDWIE